MNKDEIEIIGKHVKDMYGTPVGKVIGTITDIDGSIQTVGIDCGLDGLRQIPFEQLVVQGEVVIYIPKWRLDAQKFLREKGLTIRRLKALIDIVSENDEMKEDAEMIHEKYKSKLLTLEEAEKDITARLATRLEEINSQLKSVKVLLFDAKVQYKSNEISESKYELIKTNTGEIIEHIDHEKAEILNIQRRIADISLDGAQVQVNPKEQIQQSAVSYLVTNTTSGKQLETPTSVPSSTEELNIPEPTSAPSQDTTDADHQTLEQVESPPEESSPAEPSRESFQWHTTSSQSIRSDSASPIRENSSGSTSEHLARLEAQ